MRPRKQEPDKNCEYCGALMLRKRFNGRLEDFGAFLRRNFCSLSCANSTKEPTVAALRWRAEKLRGSLCEACGSTSKLHAHHIDGDIANNRQENIQTLCASCHITHHHATRRRGLIVAGRLEPAVSLMGYPIGHTALKDWATPSSRRSPTKSSKPSAA